MSKWTVQELARLAGVSVRTLHHYDAIGLLRPGHRSDAGYRLYGRAQLLRLQQILFFRELDMPLADIARQIDAPDFDPARTLRAHRRTLEERLGRLHRLLHTLDKTVAHHEGGTMLTDEELYRGFAPEERDAIRGEARARWGEDRVAESERRARALTKEQWAAMEDEIAALNAGLAAVMDRAVDSPEVRAAVARHHAWVATFWTPDADAYRGIGRMYRDDPRFAAYYEKVAPGLAGFLCRAIDVHADAVAPPPGGEAAPPDAR